MADFGEALPCAGVQLHDGSSPCTYHSLYAYDWAKINRAAVVDSTAAREVAEGEVNAPIARCSVDRLRDVVWRCPESAQLVHPTKALAFTPQHTKLY